jgi:hypothetical protein
MSVQQKLAPTVGGGTAPPAPAPKAPPQTLASLPKPAPDPVFQRAHDLRLEMQNLKGVDPNNAASVEKVVGRKVKSLSQFLKEAGGIWDKGGEFAARDVTNKRMPGLIRRERGAGSRDASMDAVRQRAFEAGYFPGKSDYNQISDSELADAVERDVRGEKVWPGDVEERLHQARLNQERLDELLSYGFKPGMSRNEIAQILRDMDEMQKAPE